MFTYAFLALGLICVISETAIGATMRASEEHASIKDAGSSRLITISIYSCITIATWFNSIEMWKFAKQGSLVCWIGLCLILLGLLIRWCAIHTLHKYFTVNVAIHHDHELITSGMYRYLRHPSYLGAIVSFLGMGLALGSFASIAVLVIPITLVFAWRIIVEEAVLVEAFPEEYPIYQRSTWRIVPGLY